MPGRNQSYEDVEALRVMYREVFGVEPETQPDAAHRLLQENAGRPLPTDMLADIQAATDTLARRMAAVAPPVARPRQSATYDLVLFDVDGTLTETRGGKRFRERPDDWRLLPNRVETIAVLHQVGMPVALVTNQGGAAYGYFTVEDMRRELDVLTLVLGLSSEDVYVCFTHPEGTVAALRCVDSRRKPGTGMLVEAMDDHAVEPSRTLMVGDRSEDKDAADAAGVHFQWARDFFGDVGDLKEERER